MRRRTTTWVGGCAAFLAIALAACGGDDSSDDTTGEDASASAGVELARYMAADSFSIATVDLVELREELSLPSDADAAPTDISTIDQDGPETQLVLAAARVLDPTIAGSADVEPELPLDGTQIQAMASDAPSFSLTMAVKTTQPFDDIIPTLEDQGFAEEDGVWVRGDATSTTLVNAVADAGDGVIAIGSEPQYAQFVVDSTGQDAATPSPLISALEAVSGPFRVATREPSECVETLAVGQSADAQSGDARLETAPDNAEPNRFKPDPNFGITFGDAEATGHVLNAPFTLDDSRADTASPAAELEGGLAGNYDCS